MRLLLNGDTSSTRRGGQKRLTLDHDNPSRTQHRLRTRRRARALLLGAMLAMSMLVTACGGSSSGSVSKGPLTIGVLQPFEGSEAFLGPDVEALCYAAINQVNAAGGLLGHKVQCTPYDTTSDPADAVPVANRMLATASNLVAAAGPADVEPAIEPLLNNAKLLHLAFNGLPPYDHQTSPYFYRPFPSDSLAGVSEAIYLVRHGYTHAAAVFDTSSGSQNQVPNLLKTYKKLGGKFAISLTLAPGDTYRTEVSRLLAAKPDAIVSELDSPQEVAAWYSELAQLSGGKVPPLVPTAGEITSTPNWPSIVQHAFGSLPANIVQISPGGALGGAGYAAYEHALLTAPQKIADRKQYLGQTYTAQYYDGIVLDMLAIDEANSTDSAKVAPLIEQISNGVPGATTVNTYAEGAKAIAAGHRVHYVGTAGAMTFNKYHNIVTPSEILRYEGAKAGWVALPQDNITAQQIAKATP